jgi:hypothetical protein
VRSKVIYVSIMRLTARVASHWFVDYLVDHGVDVEYWDVLEALRDSHYETGSIERPYLRRFRSLKEVDAALSLPENADALYVMLITYTGHFTNIYRLLSQHGARTAMITWGVLPTNPAHPWRKILKRYSSPAWLATTAFYIAKAKLWRKLMLVNPPAVHFAAGRIALHSASGAERTVAINSVDYDAHVRAVACHAHLVDGLYAVFLDINLPYQSDLSLARLRAVRPEEYYRSLNRLFRILETVFELKIIIALHPKAAYGSEKFEGRGTYRGVTAELVHDAQFVITHTSTAMSYAILTGKPLLFVSTNEMQKLYKDNLLQEMHNYARYLDASLVNADAVRDAVDVRLRPVNVERYLQYKYDFLTSPDSENMTTRDIFLGEIDAMGFLRKRSSHGNHLGS